MLPSVAELAQTLGPFATFAVALVDRSGLPILMGSMCVAVGAAGGHMVTTVALGTLGMTVGDLALFELGRRHGGRGSFQRRLLRPLKPLRATARAILRRFPELALLFGRYVAGAGILLPLFAGASGMRRSRGWLLLVTGAVLYAAPWGTASYLLGQSFVDAMDSLGPTIRWAALAGLLTAAAAFGILRVLRRARRAARHAHPHSPTRGDDDAHDEVSRP